MIAKRDIYDRNANLLVRKGAKVTVSIIKKLKRLGYFNPKDIESSEEINAAKTTEVFHFNGENRDNASRLTQDFKKKIHIRDAQYLEVPSKILSTIIFESRSEPWWIYVNALCNYLDWIYAHSINVSLISMMIAMELRFSDKELWNIGLGAFLHDLGMLVIPKTIISKPGPLDDMEMDYVRQHCELGVSSLAPFSLPKECTDIILQHHERLDGSGYPRGLKGDAICCNGKIVMVADAIDAITSGSPYRSPRKMDEAIKIIRNEKDKYSEEIIDIFENLIEIFENA